MKRVEIFINQSIAEDLRERLDAAGLIDSFTRWNPVYGTGNSGPREGSSVWPETNSGFLLFTAKERLEELRSIIRALKEEFPDEGLKCFISEGPEEIIQSSVCF